MTQEVCLAIRDSLRSNLVDPIGRTGGQWVHFQPVPSNVNDIGKTPLIYIETAPSGGGQGITGTARKHRFIRIWITILSSINDRGMIDGQPVSGEQIITAVSNKVYRHLTADTTSITTVGQPLATSVNAIASIESVDGVGGMFDISAQLKGSKLVFEVTEADIS